MATYTDLANIQASTDFTKRSAVAVANYAKYILNESVSTTDHARRFDWAKQAALGPAAVANRRRLHRPGSKHLAAPKRVVRDERGRVSHVETIVH
jgi:hypothetical protein